VNPTQIPSAGDPSALDLGLLDPPVWRVLAGGEVYGPYTRGQMQAFIAQNRVAADTRVVNAKGGAFKRAIEMPELAELFEKEPTSEREAPANLVVISRIVGSANAALLRLLNQLGRSIEIAPGVHVLRTRVPLSRVRARIEGNTQKDDQIVIIDATHNRVGWLHLGPETDARLRQVWDSETV
jgi:hypothetical protein